MAKLTNQQMDEARPGSLAPEQPGTATGLRPGIGEPLPPTGRLLLAEDDATIRQFLGLLLRRQGYQVDFAENGLRAIELWQQGAYDLVLMDVEMPFCSGLEATGTIRELERERDCRIPIIAMTAHSREEDERRCLLAGMDGHLVKPIDFKHTLRLIADTLRDNCGGADHRR